MGEGEEAWLDVLRRILRGEPPGQFSQKTRLQNLDIPSPYTLGLFDHMMAQYPDATWSMVFETNRGCPFACTFCDWGGVTYSKIKKFNLEKVQDDLEWAVDRPIEYLFCADANFGTFRARDLEIARMIRDVSDRSGLIKYVNLQYAKNSSEIVFEIAKILGPISQGVTVSVQSLHDDTLEAVKRRNMEINDIRKMMKLSEEHGVTTNSDMIIGLPLETLETWKTGITDLLDMGQHNRIDVWFSQLLANSELSQPQSRIRYGIKSVIAKNFVAPACIEDLHSVPEEMEIITGTNTMGTGDLVEGYMYAWMIVNFHGDGYSQFISRWCHHTHGVSFRSYYDALFEKIKSDAVFEPFYQEIKQMVSDYLHTGDFPSEKIMRGSGKKLHAFNSEWIYLNRRQAYTLAYEVAGALVPVDHEALVLQENFLYDDTKTYPLLLDVNFNVRTWQPEPCQIEITPNVKDIANFNAFRAKHLGLLRNNIKIL
jgi:hypothetical protein